ncbi:MAG: InlB B-repeat-containing protein, partial [Clostridiales bacterium]|nr:InlB B-repeat-containing protein [Clostridiales bacterium]
GDDSAACDKAFVEVSYKGNYGVLPDASRNGHDFLGWYTAAVGGDKIVFVSGQSGNTKVTNRESHTLYAHWAEKTYTVALNANAGGDSVTDCAASVSVKFGATYSTLPKNPKRVGYTFLGWYTAASDGSKVDNGDEVTATPYTELFAHWAPVVYTVTLNANGGSIAGLETFEFNVPFGTEFTRHGDVTPTREGYEFKGWRTAANGGSEVAASVTVSGNTVMYADWAEIAKKTVSVTFDTHVTGMSVSGKTVDFGGAYGALPSVGERVGYTFLGWFTSETGGTLVTENTLVPDVTSVVLHACWEINSYTVTFDADGGEIAGLDTLVMTAEYNGSVKLPTPVRNGYVFDGWFNASTKVGMGGEVYSVTENVTLTAQWSQYTVTFDVNYDDATETVENKTFAVGATYGSDLPTPSTREGFEFKGWCTDKTNATATTVGADDIVSGNVTLYAVWEVVSA